MVGHPTVTTKPSRSDEVLDPDQQLRIADQVRAEFESKAPKRPIKPNRSESAESDPQQEDEGAYVDDPLPEYAKLQSLKSQSDQVVLSSEGDEEVQEEFVETEYYNKLVSIDKQHHTTGMGFIRVDAAVNGSDYDLNGNYGETKLVHITRSNPATNDWIPIVEEDQVVDYVSSKPIRSG